MDQAAGEVSGRNFGHFGRKPGRTHHPQAVIGMVREELLPRPQERGEVFVSFPAAHKEKERMLESGRGCICFPVEVERSGERCDASAWLNLGKKGEQVPPRVLGVAQDQVGPLHQLAFGRCEGALRIEVPGIEFVDHVVHSRNHGQARAQEFRG